MSTELAKATAAPAIESALIRGDLSALTTEQRLSYYNQTCASLGLNPLTQPFAYITLNGKLTLYAKRDATEQLRKINGVSIAKLEKQFEEGLYIVTAYAVDNTGRADVSTGAVAIEGLKGEARANAIMKAETKAKRRVTLSICGLGMLDETEASGLGSTEDRNPEYKWDTKEEREAVVQKRLAEIKEIPPNKAKSPNPDPDDIEGWGKLFAACQNAADFNSILPSLRGTAEAVKIAIMAEATKKGVAFDREGKRFVDTAAVASPTVAAKTETISNPSRPEIVRPSEDLGTYKEPVGVPPLRDDLIHGDIEPLDSDPLAPAESANTESAKWKVTLSQQRRMFALAKKAGVDEARLREMAGREGAERLHDLTPKMYESICNELENLQLHA